MLTERELEIRDVKDAINIIKDYCIDCGECSECADEIKAWCRKTTEDTYQLPYDWEV